MIQKQVDFAREILTLPRDKLVFVDEFGINTAMTPRFARAASGKRAFARAPYNRGENISTMAAMREDAVMVWRPHVGAINGDRFVHFVQNDLARKLEKGDIVALDNIRFHKSHAVRESIEGMGARILFTPPYSPDMNAIEELFSFVKHVLRRQGARNIPNLLDAVKSAFSLSRSHLRKYVTHTLKLAAQLL